MREAGEVCRFRGLQVKSGAGTERTLEGLQGPGLVNWVVWWQGMTFFTKLPLGGWFSSFVLALIFQELSVLGDKGGSYQMFLLSEGKGAAREWLQGRRLASTGALSVPGRLTKTLLDI